MKPLRSIIPGCSERQNLGQVAVVFAFSYIGVSIVLMLNMLSTIIELLYTLVVHVLRPTPICVCI